MKFMKWVILLFILVFLFLWVIYFYLEHQHVVQKSIQPPKKVEEENKVLATKSKDSWEETVVSFCTALYSGGDVSPYTTEQVKTTVVPPGDNLNKTSIKVQIKIENIQVYAGAVTNDSAESIAAITRSITVNSSTTTHVEYVLLHLRKQNVWKIQDIKFLADVP
ncbi:hypothetical protein [Ectobacillus polymachus]|uniref:hypothetical protein n=1 Tax=Ectobacillus polymachus TaxID=1508806 RepID=UPI003A8A32A3